MSAILQDTIPYDPLAPRALPGVQPTTLDNWLHRDDAFDAQIQQRKALLAERRDEVLALHPDAEPAAAELLDLVQSITGPGSVPDFKCDRHVPVKRTENRSLDALCSLAQEDFCILEKRGDEHVLTGAILCFPASWRLSEKFMRPLTDIHTPVQSYDANIGRRVQRLFDGVRVDRPMWRFNALWYDDPDLFQPRSVKAPRPVRGHGQAPYLRSERQTVLRLPRTGAVVFSIHTYVLAANRLIKMENPA